jgi:hypothetical protein
MSPTLLNLNLKWLGPRISEGAYYPESMFLLLLKMICFYDPGYVLVVLHLWSQARPWGIHPAAINGDIAFCFTTIC